jgi:hypothetical protein
VGWGEQGEVGRAYFWLLEHPYRIDGHQLLKSVKKQLKNGAPGLTELTILVHYRGDDDLVMRVAKIPRLYDAPAWPSYVVQAAAAFEALLHRTTERSAKPGSSDRLDLVWIEALKSMLKAPSLPPRLSRPMEFEGVRGRPSRKAWSACASLIQQIIVRDHQPGLEKWFDWVNKEYGFAPPAEGDERQRKPKQRQEP